MIKGSHPPLCLFHNTHQKVPTVSLITSKELALAYELLFCVQINILSAGSHRHQKRGGGGREEGRSGAFSSNQFTVIIR